MTFADDAGEYAIFIKNPHGEVSASASLLEEGIQHPLIFVPCIFVGPVAHSFCASIFPEQYEAFMKQHDVTYKTEVTTTVIQKPSVVVSQYELEQRRVTTPMSFVSEKVRSC